MVVNEKPLNREPKTKDLLSSFITKEGGFDRNHGPIPDLSAATHTITVDGLAPSRLTLTIPQLRNDFPQHTVLSALQCAGNRRHEMRTKLKEVQGIDWNDAAVLNAQWRGPRLCDILARAGVSPEQSLRPPQDARPDDSKDARPAQSTDELHVQFACHGQPTEEDDYYGGSIPLSRALRADADVLLALDMNGAPLTPAHGFPVRVVVPGVAGARSVKWLDRVTVARAESENFYQRHDYKVLPPEAVDKETAERYWGVTPSLGDMPVNSVVGIPASGTRVERDGEGRVEARGYALPGGEHGPVTKVEVSGDEGQTWVEARLDWGGWDEPGTDGVVLKWAWCLWSVRVGVEKGKGRRIWSRATDASGNVQPREGKWTLRGIAYSAYGESEDLEVV